MNKLKTFLVYSILPLLFSSCNNIKSDKISELADTTVNFLPQDSNKNFIILEFRGDTLQTLSKSDYEDILKNELQEIVEYKTLSPDSLYHIQANRTLNYGSEQGQDLYYLIYAKYLSENMNKDIPEKAKNDLEEIFHSVNVFMNENGLLGLGFFHMSQRITAYAQHELIGYNRKHDETKPNTKIKKEFLNLLEKKIEDRNSEIMKLAMKDFDKIIDSEFKLRKTIKYMNQHYEQLKITAKN
jgi:hypothetical protein